MGVNPIYACVCTHICIYIYIYIYMYYTCIPVYLYIYICVCVCVSIYIYICLCVHVSYPSSHSYLCPPDDDAFIPRNTPPLTQHTAAERPAAPTHEFTGPASTDPRRTATEEKGRVSGTATGQPKPI